MRLQEIENAFSRFKVCPKCNSGEGFWFGVKHDKPYAICKSCGAAYEFHEVYAMDEKTRTSKSLGLKFLRK